MRFLQSSNNPLSATPFQISLSNTQYLEWENSQEPRSIKRASIALEEAMNGDISAPSPVIHCLLYEIKYHIISAHIYFYCMKKKEALKMESRGRY